MDHFIIWGQFLIAAILVVIAGYKLTRYGDVFSEKFKLGHVFIGSVLIGWCTSLPELVLSIGTVAYIQPPSPSISIGNVLGSNLFNIFIIVFLDIIYWKGPILRKAEPNVKLSVWFSLGMAVLLGLALFFSMQRRNFLSSYRIRCNTYLYSIYDSHYNIVLCRQKIKSI